MTKLSYCIILSLFVCTLYAQNDIFNESILPIFIIETGGEPIVNEPKITAHLGVIYNHGSINKTDDPFNHYDGLIGIEIRGNGTVIHEKVSYAFETRLADGSNNNVELLNLPKENDWILYGPYVDKSLLRNVLTFDLANELGIYSSRTKFCELIINDQYLGLYVLMEKIKRDKNRVNVTEFSEGSEDPSEGGYIVRIDSYWSSERGWKSDSYYVNDQERIISYQYVYPKYKDITQEQKQYIQNLISDFENDLYKSENPDINEAYSPYIDIKSFVDFFLINELSKNPDAYRLSTFMYKDIDSKDPLLKMGPFWDYNFAYGNYFGYEHRYHEWEYDNHWWTIPSQIPFWWNKLLQDPIFTKTVIERWAYMRENVITCENINTKIDSWAAEVKEAQERNYSKWPILGTNGLFDWNAGDTYEDEIQYLKDWTCGRIKWMDEELSKLNSTFIEESYIIYPNPASDNLTVRIRSTAENKSDLFIYDVLGNQVFGQPVDIMFGLNETPIDVSNLAEGIYFTTLTFKDSKQTKQLIITRK